MGGEVKNVGTTSNASVNALISGFAWSNSVLTYAFPDSASDYGYAGERDKGFLAVSSQTKDAATFAMDTAFGSAANDGFAVEGFTNLKFQGGSDTGAILRFADSDLPRDQDFGAWAFYPDTAEEAGDNWYGTDYVRDSTAGNWAWSTVLHELGHALGLKHGHEAVPNGALTDKDSSEYSVMTYHLFVGDDGTGAHEEFGAAQTFMMLDIAALQHMYGANYSINSGNTVYKWNPGSGDTLVNGKVAIDVGDNRIFATVWDGGGVDTYDLSSYSTALQIDLRPGNHSTFSAVQRAFLGGGPNDGFARGNIFNAMLFKGDLRSLVENARGGSGNDTIKGNQGVNSLSGNNGNDTLFGFDGKDTLDGGNGNDILVGGARGDVLKGGAGTDSASYSTAGTGVVASLAQPSINTFDAAGDTYSSIENLTGSKFADKLTGNAGKNTLNGGSGNDVLDGGAGADKLIGGTGIDTVSYAKASTGVTAFLAKAADNRGEAVGDSYSGIENLLGSAFGDKLTGDAGANKLTGYKGNDTLTGGGGADIFVFAKGYRTDTITDFQNNKDDIDLQSYNFSSAASVLSKAVQVGADVEIRLASTDVIVLKNFLKANLDASDFIL